MTKSSIINALGIYAHLASVGASISDRIITVPDAKICWKCGKTFRHKGKICADCHNAKKTKKE